MSQEPEAKSIADEAYEAALEEYLDTVINRASVGDLEPPLVDDRRVVTLFQCLAATTSGSLRPAREALAELRRFEEAQFEDGSLENPVLTPVANALAMAALEKRTDLDPDLKDGVRAAIREAVDQVELDVAFNGNGGFGDASATERYARTRSLGGSGLTDPGLV